MKRAIRSRAVQRTTISKMIKRVEAELDEETPSEKFIRTNYKIMEEYMVKIQEEDKLIWDLMIDDEDNTSRELEEEQDTVIQYKQKWLNLEIKIGEFLNPPTQNTEVFQGNGYQKGSLNETRACRLPELELKNIDGTRLEWLGWWAQFSTIHEDSKLSNVDKFQYLVQSMKENTRASRLVKSYPITADNYPKVIAALKDRFGDRVILPEVYVRQLLGLVVNNARRKSIKIEDLYDRLESYLRSLESLGITTEQNAAFLYPLVESSLPEELITVWQRSALSGYNDEGEDTPQSVDGRLGLLLKFLRREVKGEERLAYVRAGFGESSNSKSTRPNTTRLHVAEVNKPRERNLMACLFCSGDHWLRNCQKWLAMSVQKRREVLMRHRACFKCFRVGHHGRQCWIYVECNICKKSHNTLLHLGEHLVSNQGPSSSKENIHTKTESNAEKPDVSFAGMHVRTAVPTALLATALVRLVNHLNEEKVVRALLDQGSQSSFIHRDVLQGLSIPVSKVDAQIYGINATKGEKVKDLCPFCHQASRKSRLGVAIAGFGDDLRDGMALRDELIELLRCGGFTLKKWSSNDLTILGNIAKEHCAQNITFEQSKSLEKTSVTTKGEMLSFIAKLCDPLGWLAPVLVTGKIMVQRLWITGLHWDDPMYWMLRAKDQAEDEVPSYLTDKTCHHPQENILSMTTPNEVKEVIKNLGNHKAPGHDNITPQMTKNLSIKWIVFLAGIFNAALHLCYFPKTLKYAIIITIPKKSPVKSPEDLRPISLLSTIDGREDMNDEERAGRPSTSTTDEKINEVEKMILTNRRITVREVAEDLNISIGSCHSIFINDLGMRRVAANFVPKSLNCDQKQHRMNIANEMLDSVCDDPNLLQRVITGDEAWVYGYDEETKAQSSQWKLPHEPRPKKARQVRSNVKFLLTVFFDCRGVVHHEFLPQGRTVNKEYYLQVMRNLRKAIRQKRPDLWKNKNWLLHHDNAPAHTSLLVRDFLAKNNTLMMLQPPYTPDMAPCDYFLFPKLKRPMKGRRYATLDEIKMASEEELKKIF
ncbi:hypothetical protein LAZ67_2005429 [Cordylochernes scorpioides]|uniref:CCHC-type domain-containing protein n=1 Tax=Cordylochernes scorpioides TaxID=51811 RepID=A0ABY6K7Q0_9ARAC|nr:hypothetical protein LAZ67_2005429 [Cordylochernes scorpioides]